MLDLTEKTYTLISELYQNYIFYLTTSVFKEDIIKRFKIEEYVDINKYDIILDKILYTDNGSIYEYRDKPMNIDFSFHKTVKLSENIFDLFELKEVLNKESFNHIIEKYLEQLRMLNTISKMLVDKFDIESPLKENKTKTLFGLQNVILNNHLIEIENKFSVGNLKTNSIDPFLNFEVSDTKSPKGDQSILNTKKYFRDYILHDKNTEIEQLILTNYPDIKGKKLRYLIEHLIDNNAITIVYGSQKKIYESLENTFNRNIGRYTSIFGYEVNKSINSDYKNLKKEFLKIFTGIF